MDSIKINIPESHVNLLPEDLQNRWRGFISRSGSGKKVIVANTGLVNSGKSSLFNVLIAPDNIDEKNNCFAVGAARTTSSQSIVEFSHDIDFMDTPGINAGASDSDEHINDDSIALKSVLEADIIVMIDNINLGPMHKAEYEWLKKISDSMSSELERKSRIMFVCSQIDTRDGDKESYSITIQEIKNMIKEATGCDLNFYEVSVNRYITGLKKDKQPLILRSNVNTVKYGIIQMAQAYKEKYSVELNYQSEYDLCTEIEYSLTAELNKKSAEKNAIESDIRAEFNERRSLWNVIFEGFVQRLEYLREKRNTLNNI